MSLLTLAHIVSVFRHCLYTKSLYWLSHKLPVSADAASIQSVSTNISTHCQCLATMPLYRESLLTLPYIVSVCRHCLYTESLHWHSHILSVSADTASIQSLYWHCHILSVSHPTSRLYVGLRQQSFAMWSSRPQLKPLKTAITLSMGNLSSSTCWLYDPMYYTYRTLRGEPIVYRGWSFFHWEISTFFFQWNFDCLREEDQLGTSFNAFIVQSLYTASLS